jgi:hypothetical protein
VIKAESQNMTLRMHLKKWQKCWERCICAEGGWWPVGPELVSDEMAAPVPEIMDGCLYRVLVVKPEAEFFRKV